jgi:hypothetical protein
VLVGVAQPGGGKTHLNLALDWVAELDFFDPPVAADLAQDGRFGEHFGCSPDLFEVVGG